MTDESGTNDETVERVVVEHPSETEAGIAVAHYPHGVSGGPGDGYAVEQLWPNGDVDAMYLGNQDNVLALIQALAEVYEP